MRPDDMPPVAGGEPVEMTTHHLSYSAPQQRSPWHSPVPYLFGGLAAMLGLIAFALLLLACSYWKLSGYLENAGTGHGDPESGEGKPGDANACRPPVYPPEQRIVVIMAGETNPTYLATPKSNNNNISRTASAWGEEDGNDADVEEDEEKAVAEMEQGGGGESSHRAAHQVQEEEEAERGDGETHRIVDGDLRQ